MRAAESGAKPCFSVSTALSSFCTSTFATLPLEGSKLWEIMQFLSQSESMERSAMESLRSRRPARGAPKSSGPKVPKKCSPKCFRGPGWECRKKCRKTAEKMRPAPFFSISRTFSAVFRHFFRHSQPGPQKHFGEHFFGTFGPELFGAPLAGRRNLNNGCRNSLEKPGFRKTVFGPHW